MELFSIKERTRKYVEESLAKNTRKSYASDWKHFERWCLENHLSALPASDETIAMYLSFLADNMEYKVSTIERRLASIAKIHRVASKTDIPTKFELVHSTMRGIRRMLGSARSKKEPLLDSDIARMINFIPNTSKGLRDKCIILVGFGAALRRSEIVGLNVDDMFISDEGLIVTIRKSKTDRERTGQRVGIPYAENVENCPVQTYIEWLKRTGLTGGPIFRPFSRGGRLLERRLSAQCVDLIVKKYAKIIGKDQIRIGAHSLRAGWITSVAMRGAPSWQIARVSRHRSLEVLQGYIRPARLWDNHPGEYLHL